MPRQTHNIYYEAQDTGSKKNLNLRALRRKSRALQCRRDLQKRFVSLWQMSAETLIITQYISIWMIQSDHSYRGRSFFMEKTCYGKRTETNIRNHIEKCSIEFPRKKPPKMRCRSAELNGDLGMLLIGTLSRRRDRHIVFNRLASCIFTHKCVWEREIESKSEKHIPFRLTCERGGKGESKLVLAWFNHPREELWYRNVRTELPLSKKVNSIRLRSR